MNSKYVHIININMMWWLVLSCLRSFDLSLTDWLTYQQMDISDFRVAFTSENEEKNE